MTLNKRLEHFPLIVFFLISFLAGIFVLLFVTDYSNENTKEKISLMCEKQTLEFNSELNRIASAVDVLAQNAGSYFPVSSSLKNKSFVNGVSKIIAGQLIPEIGGMPQVCNAYVRFNPELCEDPKAGFFLSLNKGRAEFLDPTPISDYDSSDITHVGWYYIPKDRHAATWMDPYRNENVGKIMFSYVVPFYSDRSFLGVIGVDINLTEYINRLNSISYFDGQKCFLIDKAGKFLSACKPDEKNSFVASDRLLNEMVFGTCVPYTSKVFLNNTAGFKVILIFYMFLLVLEIIYIYTRISTGSGFFGNEKINPKFAEILALSGAIIVLIVQVVFFTDTFAASKKSPVVSVKALNKFDKTLVVTGDADFIPYSHVSENDMLTGHDIELTNIIANDLGYNVTYDLKNWNEALMLAENGKADLIFGVESGNSYIERKNLLKTEKVVDDTFEIFGKVKVEGLSNFEGKTFAVLKGESQFNLYGIEHESVLFDTYTEVVDAVENEICDYGFLRGSVANALITERGYKDIGSAYVLMNSHLCFAVSKDKSELFGKINAEINKLSEDGTLKKLQEKWIVKYSQNLSVMEIFRKYNLFFMITVIIFLILMLLALFFHYKRKNREGDNINRSLWLQLEALARNYVSMYLIDMKENTYQEYKSRKYIRSVIDGNETTKGAKELMPLVMKQTVNPEYLDAALEFTDLNTLQKRIKGKGSLEMEFLGNYAGWCRGRFISLNIDDASADRYIIWAVETIDEEKKRELELRHKSEIDLLTGINNRGAGEARIRELMAAGKSGMFIMFDVDKFKSVNDTYGHGAGDKVLIEIARCMRYSFRDNDVVMRLGGDEFAAFAIGALSEKTAKMIFDRLFDQINKINIPELGDRKITVSVGAAFFKEDSELTFEEIYKQADESTYASKAVNGNFYNFYKAQNV